MKRVNVKVTGIVSLMIDDDENLKDVLTEATLVKVTSSNDVIIVGNTLPSGISVTTPVNSTGTTNLISVSNSWD